MLKLKLIGILIAALTLAACQSAPATPVPPTATPIPSPTAPPSRGNPRSIPASIEEVPRITPQELMSLLDQGRNVVVVDTRSRDAYETAHIPGALYMPASEVEARYRELPLGTKIVTYCA